MTATHKCVLGNWIDVIIAKIVGEVFKMMCYRGIANFILKWDKFVLAANDYKLYCSYVGSTMRQSWTHR